MDLEFFLLMFTMFTEFFWVGVARGAVGSVVGRVVLGCFGIVEFFLVMFTACILWRPTLRHF